MKYRREPTGEAGAAAGNKRRVERSGRREDDVEPELTEIVRNANVIGPRRALPCLGLARRKLLERGKKVEAPVLVRVASIFTGQEWETLVPIGFRPTDAVPPPWLGLSGSFA